MSSSLQQILKRPQDRAPVITITGDSGVGKTTLSALFPKPVVLRLEDGVESIPAARRPYSFPMATTYAEACGYVDQLATESHPFQTLVVDSVSQLGAIIESEIIGNDKRHPASINQALGGYGAGRAATAQRQREFVARCLRLNLRKDMAIVFVCHSTVATFEPPDGEAYNRFVLRLDNQSTQPYVDATDAVIYIRMQMRYVTKEDAKLAKAKTSSTRMLVMHPTGAHVAKNRYGVEEPVMWQDKTRNPLLKIIPFYHN
jgi:hypothetical protein